MQWLDLALITQAASSLLLSSLNCLYFARYVISSRRAARRVGAAALTLVNGGLALEAATYLAFATTETGVERLAVLGLRTVLFIAACFVSLLIWRQGWRRRP